MNNIDLIVQQDPQVKIVVDNTTDYLVSVKNLENQVVYLQNASKTQKGVVQIGSDNSLLISGGILTLNLNRIVTTTFLDTKIAEHNNSVDAHSLLREVLSQHGIRLDNLESRNILTNEMINKLNSLIYFKSIIINNIEKNITNGDIDITTEIQDMIVSYVNERLEILTNEDPTLLDTIKEVADAIGNDPDFFKNILYNDFVGQYSEKIEVDLNDLILIKDSNYSGTNIKDSIKYININGLFDNIWSNIKNHLPLDIIYGQKVKDIEPATFVSGADALFQDGVYKPAEELRVDKADYLLQEYVNDEPVYVTAKLLHVKSCDISTDATKSSTLKYQTEDGPIFVSGNYFVTTDEFSDMVYSIIDDLIEEVY